MPIQRVRTQPLLLDFLAGVFLGFTKAYLGPLIGTRTLFVPTHNLTLLLDLLTRHRIHFATPCHYNCCGVFDRATQSKHVLDGFCWK